MEKQREDISDTYFEKIENYYNFSEFERAALCDDIAGNVESLSDETKKELSNLIFSVIDNKKERDAALLYSLLLAIRTEEKDVKGILKMLLDSTILSVANIHFIYQQLKHYLFLTPQVETIEVKALLWNVYKKIVDSYASEVDALEVSETTADNLVVVLIEQFLTEEHGPTKTAMDRCKTLIGKMNKKVLLVNTAEQMSLTGQIPWVGTCRGNYNLKLSNVDSVNWYGQKIPYFQCDNNMPEIATINYLLHTICNMHPRFIIDIGGESIVGNIISRKIPVLAVGCVPSKISCTCESFQTYSKNISKEDSVLLEKVGRNANNVIKSVFTSGLKEMGDEIEPEKLNLPQNKMILTVVGGRLKNELNNDFLDMLSDLGDDFFTVFLGDISSDGWITERNSKLKGRVRTYGFVNDVRSYLKHCDLYVNPYRNGGGTSGVEAMSVGVPVVSIDFGDVAINSGSDFTVKDYEEMKEVILKYRSDDEFYRNQSNKAFARAALLQDTDRIFEETVNEFLLRAYA